MDNMDRRNAESRLSYEEQSFHFNYIPPVFNYNDNCKRQWFIRILTFLHHGEIDIRMWQWLKRRWQSFVPVCDVMRLRTTSRWSRKMLKSTLFTKEAWSLLSSRFLATFASSTRIWGGTILTNQPIMSASFGVTYSWKTRHRLNTGAPSQPRLFHSLNLLTVQKERYSNKLE